MESGRMTRLMEVDSTFTLMVPLTMANGKRTNSTVKGLKLGQMVPDMKGNTSMVKSTVMESLTSLMPQFMKAISNQTRFKVRESTPGQTVKPMMENGKTIK